MYFLKRNSDLKTLCSFVHFYRFVRKSHYDILNLRKNCTDKEIKDAFIKMSKEYHPDKNKDVNAHEHFVRIMEAYNVLSKPSSRAHYDSTYSRYGPSYSYGTNASYQQYQHNYYQEAQQKASSNENANSYSGAHGVRKVPNSVLIMLCIGIAVIGVLLQVVIIRESYFIHRRKLREKSIKLEEELDRAKSAAQGNSNEALSKMLLEKIALAANNSAATASLGQALADEKK